MSVTATLSPAEGLAAPVEARSAQRLRAHYDIERELADRLRDAPASERRRLYATLYDELFRRVPDHPQLTSHGTVPAREREVDAQMRLLGRFLTPRTTLVEIGPGDCALSFRACATAREVVGVDVSAEITRRDDLPRNFQLRLSDGVTVPVPAGSADVVYSHQLMEHLHPDDAAEQLRGIVAALAPGGVYVCVTPSRLSGPHDISRHFDPEARGLHLKEYTATELTALFVRAGFARARAWITLRGRCLPVPGAWMRAVERALAQASPRQRRQMLQRVPYRWFSTLAIVAEKARA
ncbi:MAG: class I SAM-dependent methyltransferase [Rubrivivax sp.]